MKQKFAFLFFFSVLFLNISVKAQNCDPWIQQLYKELYNRSATTEECNIRNYNNGSWNNYDELRNYIKAYNSKKSASTKVTMPTLQGDPWIFQIYKELYNRQPNAWEININNYNGGSWNNYNELKNYIKAFQNSLRKQRMDIKTGPWKKDEVVVGFFINNQQVAVNVVSAGGGNVVSAGGANVISAGGDNVVSPGGGNVVSPGGGNIMINANMAGVNFGSRYTVQSEGTKIIPTSGKGALIIK